MAIQKTTIQRETLGESAYRHLARGFLNNELLPGTRLLMDELAEQMDISRTPVREALHRLEREGVIEPHGRRGYVVCGPTTEALDQRSQARKAIEGYAVEYLTASGGEPVRRLVDAYEKLLQQPQTTPEEVFIANRGFHRLTVEMLDNPLLVEASDLIWNQSLTSGIWKRLLESSDDVAGDFERVHTPLIETIQAGDVAAAHALVIAHIDEGRAIPEI